MAGVIAADLIIAGGAVALAVLVCLVIAGLLDRGRR
jgi:hypothetical protein